LLRRPGLRSLSDVPCERASDAHRGDQHSRDGGCTFTHPSHPRFPSRSQVSTAPRSPVAVSASGLRQVPVVTRRATENTTLQCTGERITVQGRSHTVCRVNGRNYEWNPFVVAVIASPPSATTSEVLKDRLRNLLRAPNRTRTWPRSRRLARRTSPPRCRAILLR
jgi:hypothetical protein